MVKHERFVVIAKLREQDDSVYETSITSFDNYPTDEQLQEAWMTCRQHCSVMYYLKVEKQVRFD